MTDKEALKKLLHILKDYRRNIVAILVCLLLSTGIGLCMPIINSRMMDDGFVGGDWQLLIYLVLLTLLLFCGSSVLDVFKEKRRLNISTKIKMRLEEEAFSHLMKMKISYFQNKNYAEILSNLNMDIGNISVIAEEHLFFVITQVFRMVGGAVGLFILDVRLTVLVLLFLPMKYSTMKYFAKKKKSYMDSYIAEAQEYSGWFGDAVGGVKEIREFGIFENKLNEFRIKKGNVIQREKSMTMLEQWNSITDAALIQVMMALLYIVGANFVLAGELSIGYVFAFINYSVYVTAPISAILNIGYYLAGILPSTKRYYEFLDYEEECNAQASSDDNQNLRGGQEGLVFENVSFSYDGITDVLADVSFSVAPNTKVAIIGDNGSGKSTILDLLLRFYEPAKGRILLGGKDIRQYSLSLYRDMISVVGQNIYLFNDTVRNNIALYKSVNDDIIKEACVLSGLEEFIETVSLDYCVGQNGVMLSGGQKQKIAMARALVHDRSIVVFDEATSNADSDSIKRINGLLYTRLKNKTVIIVSHQIDILKNVDYVFRLE